MDAAHTYTSDFLDAKRLIGDEAADTFVEQSFADARQKRELFSWLQTLTQNTSLDSVSAQYSSISFIDIARQLPAWADPSSMQQASAFFLKYAEQIMQLLGLLSLPYCYAAADGAMVLYLSKRIKDDPAQRLADTAEFIWDVMSPSAFQPDGKGFSSCLKIRLTHAAARYYTLKSGDWDDRLGYPVNQEDMAGTNLSFSLIVVRGLRKLGYAVSYSDQQAFIHLWNVIGTLLGLQPDLVPHNGKAANALDRAVSQRHFKASPQGRELTFILVSYIVSISKGKASEKQTITLMRYLLGPEVSNLLDLPDAETPSYLPVVLKLSANWPDFKSDQLVMILYRQKYLAYKKGIA